MRTLSLQMRDAEMEVRRLLLLADARVERMQHARTIANACRADLARKSEAPIPMSTASRENPVNALCGDAQ